MPVTVALPPLSEQPARSQSLDVRLLAVAEIFQHLGIS